MIAITRYPGKIKRYIDSGEIEWMPDLAPSAELMQKVEKWKADKEWNAATFGNQFVPLFIRETTSPNFKKAVREVKRRSREGEKICLACFCKNPDLCHRSIVIGLLQADGDSAEPVIGKDYSPYMLYYLAEVRKQTKEAFYGRQK